MKGISLGVSVGVSVGVLVLMTGAGEHSTHECWYGMIVNLGECQLHVNNYFMDGDVQCRVLNLIQWAVDAAGVVLGACVMTATLCQNGALRDGSGQYNHTECPYIPWL